MHDKPSGAVDERATTAAEDIKDRARVYEKSSIFTRRR
jgi:hypothetical protein